MLEQLKKEVYEANMELQEKGMVIYTWGNVSGIDRENNYVVIKPSGVEYDELSPEELAKATSKEQILTDLVIARRRMKEGTKEWTEQTRLIAEYARIKQDELQTEDSTVHFFLPCDFPTGKNDCVLFKNGLCNGGK